MNSALIAAVEGENIRNKVFEMGAVGYVERPVDTKELSLRVRNILTSRKLLNPNKDSKYVIDVDATPLTNYDELFLNKVLECIQREYSNAEFSIDTLERELAMSHACFYRKLKALTGMSAKTLLQDVRLRHAERLLKESEIRVVEVAEAVGFNSIVNFSSCFKKKYGVSPMQYRKNIITEN